jgi:hypothetical protein
LELHHVAEPLRTAFAGSSDRSGAPESSTHLWPAASETTVKRSALFDYRGVYFAMHDLVADEIKGLAERSRVLTLPKEPTDND